MVKKVKYSEEKLLKFIQLFENRVYLLFYDLDCICFRDTTNRLSLYMEIIETKTIKLGRENCLVIFGCLNICKLKELISELDCMDISEFDISEYSNKQEDFNVLDTRHSSAVEKLSRVVYVNKDERIIQLYNFQ